jgi:hypothetical protein
MSDDEADGALEMGQHGSLLGKDGSAYDFLRARFDALTAEESRLLRDTIKLGTSKSDAARRRAIMARIEDIQVECRLLKDYFSRASWRQQQQWQQRPHSSLNISGSPCHA